MGPSYTSGTVVGPVAPQGDIVLPSSGKSGSGKKVAIIVIIILVLVAAGLGIWFLVSRGGGFGGTAEQKFNRFANYLLYEEESDEWTHGDEEFSMDLADDFENRFYGYSDEEWGNYIGKVKKLWDSYAGGYDGSDSYIVGMGSYIVNDLVGFIEIFEYVNNLDVFGDELNTSYDDEGRAVTGLIQEKYAPLLESSSTLAREVGENMKNYNLSLLETYALSAPTNTIEQADGETCYDFDGYSCLTELQVEDLRSTYYGRMMTNDNERSMIIGDGALELVYSAWQVLSIFNGEEE